MFPPEQHSRFTSNLDSRTQPFGNAGASCYINATLQSLLGLPSVRKACNDVLEMLSNSEKERLLRADYRDLYPSSMVYVHQNGPLDGDVLLAITMRAAENACSSLYPDLFLQPHFWNFGIHEDAHEK
eukprot:6707457-Karenia_brevis.AAC.1